MEIYVRVRHDQHGARRVEQPPGGVPCRASAIWLHPGGNLPVFLPSVFLPSAFFLLACCGQRGGIHALAFWPVVAPTRSPMSEEISRQADDLRLIEAVVRGERDAFAKLYDRLSGPLYAMCLRMTGDAAETEDIIQDACVTIWRRAATYDAAQSSVFSWAVHLTRCKAIDHLRSRGRRLRVLVPDDPAPGNDDDASGNGHASRVLETAAANGPGAAEFADQHERAGRVRRIMGALPAEQCQAIEMAFFGDLTHHEISARLGQPLGTVKARIRRDCCKFARRTEGDAMISEHAQEQAALYALGLLDADEAAAFEQLADANAEVRALAEELREAAAVWRRRTRTGLPPPGLRTRVLAEIARGRLPWRARRRGGRPAPGKVVQGPWAARGAWLPWAAAAVLMICCGALAVSREHGRREIASLRSEAVGLRRESEQWRMSAMVTPAPTDALRQVAFCPLEPVKAASLPRASVLWDAEHHRGKLRITRLPPPGKGKDYELWVVEDGRKEPVSAGVVTLNADGSVEVPFEPVAEGGRDPAVAFALSLEREGGSPTNQGPILFLGKL